MNGKRFCGDVEEGRLPETDCHLQISIETVYRNSFQSLISIADILVTFLQNECIMVLYRTLSLIASKEIRRENGYFKPSASERKARLAPTYALPMVESGVSRNNSCLRKPTMAGDNVCGRRAGSRMAQDSRLDEALRNFKVGKKRDARRVIRRDRKSGRRLGTAGDPSTPGKRIMRRGIRAVK